MKLKHVIAITAAMVGFSGAALAGYTLNAYVTISGSTMSGNVASAHGSADTVQYIGCNTYAYASGTASGSCYGKNAAGTYKVCLSTNPQMHQVMRSVNAGSKISFTIAADGSTCDQVSISNGSASARY